MKFKIKRNVVVLLLVLCYSLGNMLFTGYADISDMTLDELLSHRENQTQTQPSEQAPQQQKKVSISDFTDVKQKDWFYPYLEYLVDRGTVNGKTPDTFEPSGSFSYAECAAVIVRYLGLSDEAAARMAKISENCPELSNQWYLGYFDVLSEIGLFHDYELFEKENGHIVSVDKEKANSPIVRYRFAESISKSFELSVNLRANNTYFEIGGLGREFIIGGGYKEDVLSLYAEKIADFDQIPQQSRENVLKAYYNGIFNGDTTGNFYPHNNLTRAEMAKVLATVMDYSQRTRLIDDLYGHVLSDDELHTDAFGNVTAHFNTWSSLLMEEADRVTVSDGRIEYISGANAPIGYAIDAYFYEKQEQGYYLSSMTTLNSYNGGVIDEDAENARILLVLRNVRENSRPEGVVSIEVDGGIKVSTRPNMREM